MSERHKDGKEYLDDTPVSVPAGFRRPPSIHEMIKQYIRTESFRQKMEDAGLDTEEEANDFEVEDDDDPIERMVTRHELSAMAADELRDLLGVEEFNKMRDRLVEAHNVRSGHGRNEGKQGTGSVGQAGKADSGIDKSESGAAQGDRKEAERAPKSGG